MVERSAGPEIVENCVYDWIVEGLLEGDTAWDTVWAKFFFLCAVEVDIKY